MKGSSIFQLRSWPKIHQPLPRTPRESQQLLNALTSSFRRQLDNAYPTSSAPNDAENNQSSIHATDQHMHNILDNPLFRIVPPKDAGRDPHARQSLEQQRRLTEEPMVVLDELVASGSVTHTAIFSCLNSQLLLSRSPGSNGLKAMRDARAASRVIDFFWASEGDSRHMILGSWKVTASLTKFMVAENLQETGMQWLMMLLHQDLGTSSGQIPAHEAQKTFSRLLLDLVDAELQYGAGFGSALKYYLRACDMVFKSSHSGKTSRKSMLLATGGRLGQTTFDLKASIGRVPVHAYEEFMGIISTLAPRSLLSTAVAICHPDHPDPRPFVKFAQSISPGRAQSWSESKRDALLMIGCEAIRLLVEQKKMRDATNLGQRIQHLLPDKTTSTVLEESYSNNSSEDRVILHHLDLNMA